MEKKLENSIRKFGKKYANKIYATPKIWRAMFDVRTERKKPYNYSKNDHSYVYAITTMFNKLFLENEAIKSLKYKILTPFVFKENSSELSIHHISPLLKKKEFIPLTSLVFALYDFNKKEFLWLAENTLPRISKEFFKNAPFIKKTYLKNVSLEQADSLAVLFRTMFYDANIEYYNKEANKLMKTHNLVFFTSTVNGKEDIRIFTLVDLGFKDPPYKKEMEAKLGLAKLVSTMYNEKNQKSFKSYKSHKSYDSLISSEFTDKSKRKKISNKKIMQTYKSLNSKNCVTKKCK